MVAPCTLPAKFAVSGIIRTVIESWWEGWSTVLGLWGTCVHARSGPRVTYSRNTPSMRACHPLPVDLKYANTSGL